MTSALQMAALATLLAKVLELEVIVGLSATVAKVGDNDNGTIAKTTNHRSTDGHFARDCPEPRKYGGGACFNCGEEGHGKAECTNARVARAFDGECRLCTKTDKYPSPYINVYSANFHHAIERLSAQTARSSARTVSRKVTKPWVVRTPRSWTCPTFPTRPLQRLGPC